jgi:lipopolysaccharide heptosyltransferase II
MSKNPHKILVVKLCCVGDIILSIPLLKTIKYNLPEAKITFLVSSWCKDMIENINEVDSIHIFNSPFERGLINKLFGLVKLIIRLRSEKFDIAINLHRNRFFGLIFLLAGIKTRIGFGNSSFYTQNEEYRCEIPESEKYLSLLNSFHFNSYENKMELSISDLNNMNGKNSLKSRGVDFSKNIIGIFADGGINPGTSMNIKQLPVRVYTEFIKKIIVSYDVQVILISPKEIKSNASIIFDSLEDKTNVIKVGGLSILELSVLFNNCVAVFGADTGLLHLAVAAGASVVMFFGPTDPRLLAPKEEKHKIIWHQIECAPCHTPKTVLDKRNFKNGVFFCKRGDVLCMESIKVEEILDAFDKIWIKLVSNS